MLKASVFSAQDILGIAQIMTPERLQNARLNQISGPAFTVSDEKGKVLACGGIRTIGIAEAWALLGDIKKNKRQVFETCSNYLEQMIRQERVWRVFAEAETPESVRLLSHLGFRLAKDEPRTVMVK